MGGEGRRGEEGSRRGDVGPLAQGCHGLPVVRLHT